MPANPLARHAHWRQIAIVSLALPFLIGLVLAAFAWPAGRGAPNGLPIGVVGSDSAAHAVGRSLAGSHLDVTFYDSAAAARAGIEHRDVYAALDPSRSGITVLTASAASPTVATLVAQFAERSAPGRVHTVDVVPLSSGDPHGTVLASSVLPLVFGGEILAVVVAVLVGFAPAWRQLLALVIASATTAIAAYGLAQSWLGALPGQHAASYAVLVLTVLAISATAAGLFELIGFAGIGIAAALMIFVGNPFGGVMSAPDLLPTPAKQIGEWLPPGAAASLLRDTTYFAGHGAGQPLAALLCWLGLGVAAIVTGHARRGRGRHAEGQPELSRTSASTPMIVSVTSSTSGAASITRSRPRSR